MQGSRRAIPPSNRGFYGRIQQYTERFCSDHSDSTRLWHRLPKSPRCTIAHAHSTNAANSTLAGLRPAIAHHALQICRGNDSCTREQSSRAAIARNELRVAFAIACSVRAIVRPLLSGTARDRRCGVPRVREAVAGVQDVVPGARRGATAVAHRAVHQACGEYRERACRHGERPSGLGTSRKWWRRRQRDGVDPRPWIWVLHLVEEGSALQGTRDTFWSFWPACTHGRWFCSASRSWLLKLWHVFWGGNAGLGPNDEGCHTLFAHSPGLCRARCRRQAGRCTRRAGCSAGAVRAVCVYRAGALSCLSGRPPPRLRSCLVTFVVR